MPNTSAGPAARLLVFVTVLLCGGVPAMAQQIIGAPQEGQRNNRASE